MQLNVPVPPSTDIFCFGFFHQQSLYQFPRYYYYFSIAVVCCFLSFIGPFIWSDCIFDLVVCGPVCCLSRWMSHQLGLWLLHAGLSVTEPSTCCRAIWNCFHATAKLAPPPSIKRNSQNDQVILHFAFINFAFIIISMNTHFRLKAVQLLIFYNNYNNSNSYNCSYYY